MQFGLFSHLKSNPMHNHCKEINTFVMMAIVTKGENKTNKSLLMFVSVFLLILMSACSNSAPKEDSHETDHSTMEHSSSGEVPDDMIESENPAFPIGSKAILKEGHMDGMKGAEATIVGAYATIAYSITYTPTNGGDKVEDHKWVVQEEIEEAKGNEVFNPGTEVTIQADHMEGMSGATATIDSVKDTTVYMVDYTPTDGGVQVTNHKWVTEAELSEED